MSPNRDQIIHRSWRDVEPADAAKLTEAELEQIDRPTNEMGETCPWPWEPQQLKGAPLGQYHCPYCNGMQVAGLPHMDWRELEVPDDGAPHTATGGIG